MDIAEDIQQMEEEHIMDLAMHVQDYLYLDLQWRNSCRQVFLYDDMSADAVTAMFMLHDGSLQERPIEVAKCIINDVEINSELMTATVFLEYLGCIKKFSYGLDIETLQPKKVLDNPFYGCKSIEELAIKLDLLQCQTKDKKLQQKSILRKEHGQIMADVCS